MGFRSIKGSDFLPLKIITLSSQMSKYESILLSREILGAACTVLLLWLSIFFVSFLQSKICVINK